MLYNLRRVRRYFFLFFSFITMVQQVQVIAKLSLQDPLPQRSRRILSIYVYILFMGEKFGQHTP